MIRSAEIKAISISIFWLEVRYDGLCLMEIWSERSELEYLDFVELEYELEFELRGGFEQKLGSFLDKNWWEYQDVSSAIWTYHKYFFLLYFYFMYGISIKVL